MSRCTDVEAVCDSRSARARLAVIGGGAVMHGGALPLNDASPSAHDDPRRRGRPVPYQWGHSSERSPTSMRLAHGLGPCTHSMQTQIQARTPWALSMHAHTCAVSEPVMHISAATQTRRMSFPPRCLRLTVARRSGPVKTQVHKSVVFENLTATAYGRMVPPQPRWSLMANLKRLDHRVKTWMCWTLAVITLWAT